MSIRRKFAIEGNCGEQTKLRLELCLDWTLLACPPANQPCERWGHEVGDKAEEFCSRFFDCGTGEHRLQLSEDGKVLAEEAARADKRQ